MINFTSFPKQWLISPDRIEEVVGGKQDFFSGWHLAAAEAVPILRLYDADGFECGRLIGWVIEEQHLHLYDGDLALGFGESPEELFMRLAGRFVMLWRCSQGELRLREDASGGLPAIHIPEARVIGSTVTLLDQIHSLPIDAEIDEIFSFPVRRGFLPFGLTPRQGAHRLMPSHELELDGFTVKRIWPKTGFMRTGPEEFLDQARKVATVLRAQVAAILAQGETVILLSGGRDSRVVLAAARGMTEKMRAETLGDAGSRDVFIASQVARMAGLPHRSLSVLPCPDDEVMTWLERSGRMMFDPVSRLGPTVQAYDTGALSISGTGAEIMRASNWDSQDMVSEKLELSRLLEKIRIPEHPRILSAAQDWLDGLPPVDAPIALDMAKIEQIHGCWSGAAVYGHMVKRPSILPFSGRRLYDFVLSVPLEYRLDETFYKAVLEELWPELGRLPANRVSGMARLRFWREELRDIVPESIKRAIKPMR